MRSRLIVVLVCAVSTIAWHGAAAQTAKRSYSASHFALELDGVQVGTVKTVEGGLPFGEVVKEPSEDFFVKKHLGNGGYRDIRLSIGPGMEPVVYDWIASSLQSKASPKNGAILSADFNGTIVSRLEFSGALITEMTFPASDATSKEPAYMVMTLTPLQTSLNRKAGGSIKFSNRAQKMWLPANFRLSIDGLNTTRVSKIDSFSIKMAYRNSGEGECLHCEFQPPPPIDFPNLVITLAQTGAESVEQWFQTFVVAGESGDAAEKNGELTYLAADGSTELFSLRFNHLGIFELAPQDNAANGDTIARLVAAMYCESMEFSAKGQ